MTSHKTSTASKTAMAIVVAAISITAFAPAAYAEGRGDRDGQRGHMQDHRMGGDRMGGDRMGGQMGDRMGGQMMGGRGGAQFLAVGCGPNAAERIETGLVKLGYRVEATAEQKTLLDAVKTAALTAQSELATTCAAIMPAPMAATAAPDAAPAADAATAADRPNLLERMQAGVKMQEAQLAAMTDVLPAFEAFYNSLTDEQKTALEPRGPRDGRGPGRDGGREGRPMMDRNG